MHHLLPASHTSSLFSSPGASLPFTPRMHQRKGGYSCPCQEQGLRISLGKDLECRAQRPRGREEGLRKSEVYMCKIQFSLRQYVYLRWLWERQLELQEPDILHSCLWHLSVTIVPSHYHGGKWGQKDEDAPASEPLSLIVTSGYRWEGIDCVSNNHPL